MDSGAFIISDDDEVCITEEHEPEPVPKKKRTIRDSIAENMLKQSEEYGKMKTRFNYYCDFVRNGDEKSIQLTEQALESVDKRTEQ